MWKHNFLYFDADAEFEGGGGDFEGPSEPEAPVEAFDLSDDTLVRIPGQDEAVKWSDYSSGMIPKSEFTKKTQELAEQRRQVEERALQERRELLEYAKSLQAKPSGDQPTNAERTRLKEIVAATKDKGWIDSNTFEQAIDLIEQDVYNPLADGYREVLGFVKDLAVQVNGLKGHVGSQVQSSAEQKLDGMISSVISDLSIPEDRVEAAREMFLDLYLSHTGDSLNDEFPEMAKARWDALSGVVRSVDKVRADEARRRGIPGSGGSGSVSKGRTMMDLDEIGDTFWRPGG